MPINSSMFKVDSSGSVGANDDLQLWKVDLESLECYYGRKMAHLVIPPVRTGTDLLIPLQSIRSTEEVVAEVCEIVRRRLIIETNHEESIVDNI